MRYYTIYRRKFLSNLVIVYLIVYQTFINRELISKILNFNRINARNLLFLFAIYVVNVLFGFDFQRLFHSIFLNKVILGVGKYWIDSDNIKKLIVSRSMVRYKSAYYV